MKFQYPYIQALGGTRSCPQWGITAGCDYLWFDLGKFSVDFYWGLRWFSRDFRIADRLRALVGLVAYTVALAVVLPLAIPRVILFSATAALDWVLDLASTYVFKPVLDVLVPVRRYGVGFVYSALFHIMVAR